MSESVWKSYRFYSHFKRAANLLIYSETVNENVFSFSFAPLFGPAHRTIDVLSASFYLEGAIYCGQFCNFAKSCTPASFPSRGVTAEIITSTDICQHH